MPAVRLPCAPFGVTQMTRPGDGQLLVLAHQVQQHEHLVAEAVVAVGRDEQAAVLHERHVREIQGALVLDGERQQTRLVGTRSQVQASAISSTFCARQPSQQRLERQRPVYRHVERRPESRTPSASSNSPRIFNIERRRGKCAAGRISTELPAGAICRRMRSVSQFSKHLRRSAGSERLQRSAVATGSAAPGSISSSVRRVSCPSAGSLSGQPAAASEWRLAEQIQHARSSRRLPRVCCSHSSASARVGARTRSRWQRLRIVAGRREGWRRDQDQQRARGRLLQRLQQRIGGETIERIGRREDAHLVAALVAGERQLRGQLAHLLDAQLLRLLDEADAMRSGC